MVFKTYNDVTVIILGVESVQEDRMFIQNVYKLIRTQISNYPVREKNTSVTLCGSVGLDSVSEIREQPRLLVQIP